MISSVSIVGAVAGVMAIAVPVTGMAINTLFHLFGG
jgi:hypothetical protein